MTLRVVLDATPLIGHLTGVGMFVRGLIDALANQNEVDLGAYALTLRGFDELGKVLPSGVSHPHIPMPAKALLKTWARTGHPTIDRWVGDFDVVHGTNFVAPPSTRGAMLATVHDLTAIQYPQLCESATLQYPGLIRKAVQRGAHVHTLSQTMADEVSELLDIHPGRIHVVQPGLPKLPEGPGAEADWGRSLANADRYILALGTIEPRKDFPSLVKAFDVVAGSRPDLALVFAGPPGWGSEKLTQVISKAKQKSRIHVLGYVSDLSRAALLRGATVLSFPSVYEGFGLPPLEAMKESVPVVATSAGAIPEVVGDAALLTPVGDEFALVAALSRAIDDLELREELITKGLERVEQFSWERCATEMLGLYEHLVKERVA